MPKQTKNFQFNKPEANDFYDVEKQNENWDKVDEELKKITFGTEDLIPGESELPTGTIYLVYE